MTERVTNLMGALALVLTDRLQAIAAGQIGSWTAGAALVVIANHPGESVRALQNALGLTHSGAVRLLDGLEVAGLVERRRGTGGDARAAAVWLTPMGEERAATLLGERAQAVELLLAGLTRKQLYDLAPILENMLAASTTGPASARRICRLCDEGLCRPEGCPVEIEANRQAGSTANLGNGIAVGNSGGASS